MKIFKRHLIFFACTFAFTLSSVQADTGKVIANSQPDNIIAGPTIPEALPTISPESRETPAQTVNTLHNDSKIATLTVPQNIPISVVGDNSSLSKDKSVTTFTGNMLISLQLAEDQQIDINAHEIELIQK